MKDLINALLTSSKERIRNPLIGSFVLSWVIFNWNSLLVLFFSDNSIEKRIEIISPKNGIWELAFWIPFLIAIFYVVAVPYFLVLIDFLTDDSFKKRKKKASKRRVAELDSSIDVVKAEVELEKLRTEYKEVAELTERIEELKVNLKEARTQVESLSSELFESKNKNIELSNKLTTHERIIDSNGTVEEMDTDEILRKKRRVSVELKTVFSAAIDKFTTEIKDRSFENNDYLTKRIITQLDQVENALIDLVNQIPDETGEELKNTLKENFNLLEDNASNLTTRLIERRDNWTNVNDDLLSFYEPIYVVVNDFVSKV